MNCPIQTEHYLLASVIFVNFRLFFLCLHRRSTGRKGPIAFFVGGGVGGGGWTVKNLMLGALGFLLASCHPLAHIMLSRVSLGSLGRGGAGGCQGGVRGGLEV